MSVLFTFRRECPNKKNISLESSYGGIIERGSLQFSLVNTESTVLDVGCGAGAYCKELQDKGRTVIGLDILPKLLNSARKRGVDVCLADAQSLPFREKVFQTVLCFQTLEHILNDIEVIMQISRVMKKNILITVPNALEPWYFRHLGITYNHYQDRNHIRTYTPNMLRTRLESNSIQVIEIKTFTWSFSLKSKILSIMLYLIGIRPAIMVKGTINYDNK